MPKVGEWMSGKVFNYVHGNNLVYNTCWEDPRLDKIALELSPEDNLLVITSAGCNALSYALTGLNHVYTVDMNYRQNAVLELKLAGIRALDYETFFKLFGNGRLSGVKKIYREKLRDQLCPSSQMFWDKKILRYFGGRRTFYFHGTTGFFARGMNFYVDYIAHFRKAVNEMFEATSLQAQDEIWRNKIRKRLWSRLIRFMVNRDASLSMLGVPRAQRLQIEKTYEGGTVKFVQDCLDAVFGELPIADNYFWRVYTTGQYTRDCCPEYLEEENFHRLKDGLVDRISVHTGTVESFLRELPSNIKISRYVLLDHMDWLSDRYYKALVSEWDAILQTAAPKTRILWRSGGLRTDYIDTVPVTVNGQEKKLGDILEYHKEQAAELHKKDRVHTYGSFYIADLKR
ncbi:MAG: BtaA family protein [Planctomycetia bacterium]|nr:BtaA family protein [Planctomycetia bacterium]